MQEGAHDISRRALAAQAPVPLRDEPTNHFDPPPQVARARRFRRLAATHTVIIVLHDLRLAVQADWRLVMRDGVVAGHGDNSDSALHAALVEAIDHAIAVIPATAPHERSAVFLRIDE